MFGRIKGRIDAYRQKLVDGMVAEGHTVDEAVATVGAIGDGTIINLLLMHIGDITAVIKLVLLLFGVKGVAESASATATA